MVTIDAFNCLYSKRIILSVPSMIQEAVASAIDEFDALVEREKIYQCAVTNNDNDDVSLAQTLYSCPSAWRQKICEWQYKVIDH